MKLTVVDRIEGQSGAEAAVAERLRAEVLAFGRLQTRTLTRRLKAGFGLSAETVREVLEQLIQVGDVLRGTGGWLGPAPLRLVSLGEDAYLVVGCLPTDGLAGLGEVKSGGRRTLIGHDRATLLQHMDQLGGRILSLEQWSGVEREPAAGQAWLNELSRRARTSSVERQFDWDQADSYYPGEGWSQAGREQNELLRYQANGWSYFAWACEGRSWLVRLGRSEANRTIYALHRESDFVLRAGWQEREVLRVSLPRYLPLEEYRFLLAKGERESHSGLPIIFRFGAKELERIGTFVQERLGVEWTEGVGL